MLHGEQVLTCEGGAGPLYLEVQVEELENISGGAMALRLKTLPSHNFVGGFGQYCLLKRHY